MKLKAVLSILILICTQAYKMFQSAVEKSQGHLFRHRRYCVSLCLHTHACATHIHNTHTSHAHTQRKHALHSTHRHTHTTTTTHQTRSPPTRCCTGLSSKPICPLLQAFCWACLQKITAGPVDFGLPSKTGGQGRSWGPHLGNQPPLPSSWVQCGSNCTGLGQQG